MTKTILSMPVTDVRGALLVGSMPLADSAAVFTFAAQHLGRHLKRIPDGETGSRINWTQWQVDVFNGVDALEFEIFDAGYLRRTEVSAKAREERRRCRLSSAWLCACRAGVLPKVQGATAIWDDCSRNPLSSLSANTRRTGDHPRFSRTPACD